MGSKLSRTLREHKAVVLPRAAASHQNQHPEETDQKAHDHEQTGKDDNIVTSTTADAFPTAPTTTEENHEMDIDQPRRLSTDTRTAAILQDLEILPGGVLEYVYVPPHEPQVFSRPPTPPPPPPSCLICCDALDPDNASVNAVYPCTRCENVYCSRCLRDSFLEACKDLTRMPPRCCVQIPLYHARPYLSHEQVALFKSKYEEWGTAKPFYCPVARCSAFIPDRLLPQAWTNGKGKQRVDSGIGTPADPTVSCPKCEIEICTRCRGLAHAAGMCNPFECGVDKETIELLMQWGYKRCPKCGNGVKRMYGCTHMECRCGAHFCWLCMRGQDVCDGGCESDETDYESDYEPDEEEDEDQPTTPTPPAWSLAHVFPHMTPPTQPADAATLPPIASPRVINLDGGSKDYWENQDLDFGDEPNGDFQDRVWDCDHSFSTVKVGLADAFTKDYSTNNVECMRCWTTVHPEVEMSDYIGADRPLITTAVASASRRVHIPPRRRMKHVQHVRRHPKGFVRRTQSMESLTAPASPLSIPPASFLSVPPSPTLQPSEWLEPPTLRHIEDLYGNTVATAKPGECESQMQMPNWIVHEHEGESEHGLAITTNNTPFNLAYECFSCGILVCHRCGDRLAAAVKDKYPEGDEDWDENKDYYWGEDEVDEQGNVVMDDEGLWFLRSYRVGVQV